MASSQLNTFVPEENLIPSINLDVDELLPLPKRPDDIDKKLKTMQKQLLIDTVKIFNRKVQGKEPIPFGLATLHSFHLGAGQGGLARFFFLNHD